MYDELVKRLRELPHLLFVQLHGHEDVVYKAADAIEDLQHSLDIMGDANAKLRNQVPDWIPVTERLPEKDKWVLRYSAITEATWLAYLNSAGVWMDEQGEVHYVTHWQSLPEPPEEVLSGTKE